MTSLLTLRTKLLIAFLIVSLTPFIAISMISLLKSSNALKAQTFRQLESIREAKKTQIKNFFHKRKQEMGVLIQTVGTMRRQALSAIAGSQATKEDQLKAYLEERLNNVRNLTTSQTSTQALNDFSALFSLNGGQINRENEIYQSHEAKYGPTLNRFANDYGFDDLYLIDPKGNIVYSVKHLADEGQNLIEGDLNESPLAKCFKKGLEAPVVQDLLDYEIDMGFYMGFMAAPLKNRNDTADNAETIGVVAVKFKPWRINLIMQQRVGLGKSGESFLVGQDDGFASLRSNRVVESGRIGEEKSGPDVDRVLAGQSGQLIVHNEDGILQISSFSPMSLPGVNWGMLTTINLEEQINPVNETGEDLFGQYAKQYGYDDLFLIHPSGEVFFTVNKGPEYNTNILTGEFTDSNLNQLVQQIINTQQFAIADFAPYAPDQNEPAAFIGQPLINKDQIDVVVVLKLSLPAINAIMLDRAGMGSTGEAYLLGADKLMRSDAYRDPEKHSVKASFADPAAGSVDTPAAQAALAQNRGGALFTGYHGKKVLSSYAPLTIENLTWALIAEVEADEAFETVNTLSRLFIILGVIGLFSILLVALYIAGYVSRPINRVAMGLNEGADQVAATAQEVSATSQTLAEGASEQAAALEETASALEEMSVMIRQTADNSTQADKLMRKVSRIVTDTSSTMQSLTASMNAISNASEETGKIIKSIDEIAFQTNLLALNAAVEAARAGEAGAGFAIVADEVRNLAIRAADAAKSTTELIVTTAGKVRDGSDMVNQTNQAFDAVTDNAAKATRLVSEIATASAAQAKGIDQVNVSVHEVDGVTQQNAAHSEESAAAAEQLYAQSEQMKSYVGDLMGLISGGKNAKLRHAASLLLESDELQSETPVLEVNRSAETPDKSEDNAEQSDFRDF